MSGARTKKLAAIHIGREQIDFSEEDYRALLWRIGHVASAAELNDDGLNRVLDELRRLGAGRRRFDPASRRQRMIWQLWRSCARLGLVSGGEGALDRWVKRTTGADALRFLIDAAGQNKAIEGLKAMAARAGFAPPFPADVAQINAWRSGAGLAPVAPGTAALMWLIEAQWRRLAELGAFSRCGEGRLESWLRKRAGGAAAVQFVADHATAERLADELATWIARLRPAEAGE